MTKATAKTNGHTVSEIQAAPAKARAAKAPAAKPATKAVTKPVTKTVTKAVSKAVSKPVQAPAAKTASKPVAKAASKVGAQLATKPATKPSAKPASGASTKPATKPAAKSAKAAPKAAVPATGDADKTRKAKLVRDSFTMPELEYAVLGQVKKACLKAGFEIKKSELLRIGVALISQLDMATLQKVLSDLPQLKTGRPKAQ